MQRQQEFVKYALTTCNSTWQNSDVKHFRCLYLIFIELTLSHSSFKSSVVSSKCHLHRSAPAPASQLALRDHRVSRLRQLHGTGRQLDTISLDVQLAGLLVDHEPTPIQQIAVLRAVEEVLRREQDARVRFREERDGNVCNVVRSATALLA